MFSILSRRENHFFPTWRRAQRLGVTGGWGEKGPETGKCHIQKQPNKRGACQPSGAPSENNFVLFPQRNWGAMGVYCKRL